MIRPAVTSLVLVVLAMAMIYRAGTSSPRAEFASSQTTAEISLLCAAGLTPVMTELVGAFKSNVKVDISYKGSAQLVALHRIAQSGDLLIAADTFYHQPLIDQGLCDSPIIIAYQTPCLIIANSIVNNITELDTPLKALTSGKFRTSIPKRDHAAIGRLVASIEGADRYDAFARLATITRETVSQVAGDVDQGIVDVGIGWNTTALQFENTKSWDVEAWQQNRSSIGISILSSTQNADAAGEFEHFLVGEDAKTIWRRHGYAVTDDSAVVRR